MTERRYRLLFIASHPVQYSAPSFREMARHPRLEIEVAYCSMQGAEAGVDKDFGVEVKWDIPLLDGYPWTLMSNRARRPSLDRFFGLVNAGLWRMIRKGRYDAIVIYTGYRFASFWIALIAAKFSGTPFLFGTDATSLAPRAGKPWKAKLKEWLWPIYFRMADQVLVPSTTARELLKSIGIPADRISMTPYSVDNPWWCAQAARVDRTQVRTEWNVPSSAVVILFCAKLQPWKRPHDLLRAFAKANAPDSFLVYAGDGPLLQELKREAATLSVEDRVRFLGFVNQSQLPSLYKSSDLFVLPSEYEPFGVVVNEAMLCGCAVAVSDRVGAGFDLVHLENGFVYPCGDVEALAALIRQAATDPAKLKQMGAASERIIQTWSLHENIEALIGGVDCIYRRRANG
jgi:glycosyltransferase involved in cell wall biosynthesis